MKRFVIDASYSSNPKLDHWLSQSQSNIALVTTNFAIETYRRKQIRGIREAYATFGRHPKQLRVIRNQEFLCRLHTKAKGMTSRMIDDSGTADLVDLCQKMNRYSDADLERAFADHFAQADEQVAKLRNDSEGLGKEMAERLGALPAVDLYSLRTGKPYTDELIKDLLQQVISTAVDIMQAIPDCYIPSTADELINCYYVRSTLSAALALRRRSMSSDLSKVNHDKLRNDLLDSDYIATATYFDGLWSNDEAMLGVHREVKQILAHISSKY
ncbi:hypothetical protein [Rhodoferax sp. GW822-FHT02A01]|uniref:hypothetical protein n=1 Tax=Rhodoferax sp. GW822-FHT02A01 TaxID=3141537 RepID=UPI00315C7997